VEFGDRGPHRGGRPGRGDRVSPPPRTRAPAGPVPVDALRHDEKRANIPTEELHDFVADDERAPGQALYPRDPSLDPQLVWKGKDEQDREPLAVPSVPIYIQEKVHPRVIVENLRETTAAGEPEPEMTLFDDFDGIEFEELVDFYEHEQNWANRLILGDSLLVMSSLAEKERLRGKVQTIYIDPPYGIKFGSNWQVSTRKRDVKDGKVEDATRQPEQVKAFRDTWELGIHSYLTYLRDRLAVARELLTDTGSVFVQIGDENTHLVRSLLDEVFGSENFVAEIDFLTTSGRAAGSLDSVFDRLLWYARDRSRVKYRDLWKPRPAHTLSEQYTTVELGDGSIRRATREEIANPDLMPDSARRFLPDNMTSTGASAIGSEPFEYEGAPYSLPPNTHWKTNRQGMQQLVTAGRLHPVGRRLRYRRYADDFPVAPYTNVWDDTVISGYSDPKVYVVQTNTKVIERCLLMTTDPGDLVLDPTAGSGTTPVVAEKWGRRWIGIDTSRVALALARTRVMAARLPAYLLADSPEGQRQEAKLTGQPQLATDTRRDVRKGFVSRRVPHVTLKSIAQNPDIREGMSREEIDAAIARHADQELLLDQPYENKKAVRVAGPFTVESLSPHRMLAFEEQPVTEETQESGAPFATTVLENLRKAGVQNTVKQEHLDFDSLEPFAGDALDLQGEFTDAAGETRRVAVVIGPEHNTVGGGLIKEAAKEALRGVGFDLLLVCAMAFDAHAGEVAKEFQPDGASGWAVAAEEKHFGRLPVLLVRMNPDLAMGDELLKKTGSGNLFMVFGEPDVAIERTDEGQLVVEVRGVDVYDPTTGQVRSSSTDDIACWFVDTSYNQESFFVREAYFTGADDPYRSLKRALRADIDEEAWAALYRTRSRPFPVPPTGRIAVKVINHYGDEVMKAYEV
jgi:adenine-specific DNA-methyltransferase